MVEETRSDIMSQSTKTVLLVDDEPQITSSVSQALRNEPFTILAAQSGEAALDIMARERVDVIISDEIMPGMQGSELLTHVSRLYPDVIRVILTGHASMEATVKAINEGRIFRFLFKPCSSKQILEVIHQALQEKNHRERRSSLILRAGRIANWEWDLVSGKFQHSENMHTFLGLPSTESITDLDDLASRFSPQDRDLARQTWRAALEQGQGFDLEHRLTGLEGPDRWVSHTTEVLLDHADKAVRVFGVLKDITDRKRDEGNLRRSLEDLSEALRSTVHALGVTAEKRDPYTAGHQERVTHLACAIAWKMGLEEERIKGLQAAGLLHDIGKISVPAELLAKPNLLSEIELAIMKTHPAVGHEILKEIPFPWPVARIVLEHHERMDGSGYPAGLHGQDCLLESRILAVADVVEAMASHRPYRAALGVDQAMQEIRENKGLLYDSQVVDICLDMAQDLMDIFAGKGEPG